LKQSVLVLNKILTWKLYFSLGDCSVLEETKVPVFDYDRKLTTSCMSFVADKLYVLRPLVSGLGTDPVYFLRVADEASKAETALSGSVIEN